MALVLLLPLAVAGYLVWQRFVAWERAGRRELVVAAVFAVILADLLVYPSQNETPTGLFRLAFAGQSFRLTEMTLVLALLARLVVRGGPKRLTAIGLAWVAFATWYALAGVFGVFAGFPVEDILFQAKAILYLGGGVALLAGVDPSRLVTRQALGAWFVGLGAYVLVAFPLTLSETHLRVSLPGLKGISLLSIGADASSVLVVLGVIGLVVEGCRRKQWALIGLAALPMVFSVFSASQRAAMIGLAVSLVLLVVIALGPTWRRRLRTPPTTVFLALVALAAVAVTIALVDIRKGERLPVAAAYEEAFEATGKQQSADLRVLLWRQADELFAERPLLGHGLGVPLEVRVPQTDKVIDTGFHNIGYDIVTRSGLVGLGLFALAVGLSLREGLLAWRRHADGRVAALAVACVIGACSLLAKGMFEDVLEKHRLATLTGMLLGVMVVAGRAVRERRDADEDVDVDVERSPVLPARAEVPAWS
jgi:O-antigen ligase